MSEPEPYPTPGPAPYELPNDKSQAVNKKKLALRYVLDTIEKAATELEADFAEAGKKSPSESLTDAVVHGNRHLPTSCAPIFLA